MSTTNTMTVAVIIPAREAAETLPDCLHAVADQLRPADIIAIVVGPSTDHTAQLATAFAAGRVDVLILDNAMGDRASAINIALEAIDADVYAMVDAQSRIAKDYLARGLEVMEETGSTVVGGPMRPVGTGVVASAIAAALTSPFGVGNSNFHFSRQSGPVDSVYLGIYRRAAFDQVGRYNPALLRTEDDDINHRIRTAGLTIWLDPTIRSWYAPRATIAALFRQYEDYGYWKVALATVQPGAIRGRHLVPALFVVGLAGAAVASVTIWRPAFLAFVLAYLGVATTFALKASDIHPTTRLAFPVASAAMHIGYGVGTLRALPFWRRLRRRAREGGL